MSIAGNVGLEDLSRICPLISRRVQNSIGSTKTRNVIVGNVRFGGIRPVVIAGPCAVESREQTLAVARAVKDAGAEMLRGGAFKPRTSPHDFQGLGIEGLRILREVRRETGLPIVTEVMDPRLVATVAEYADMLQIGSRNMQNYPLLIEAGKSGKPVLLKRGHGCQPVRVAGRRGIYRKRRQSGNRTVRARNQSVSRRGIFAECSGLERRSRGEGRNVSSCDCGSQPRYGCCQHGGVRELRRYRIWWRRFAD